MNQDEGFKEYVVSDLLSEYEEITARAMFGGYGIYKGGKIFAIIADGGLYFKADDTTKKFFESHGSSPFTYSKKDKKTYTMRYYFVSEDILEDRNLFSEWAHIAFKAS